jgi:hypothetical protein
MAKHADRDRLLDELNRCLPNAEEQMRHNRYWHRILLTCKIILLALVVVLGGSSAVAGEKIAPQVGKAVGGSPEGGWKFMCGVVTLFAAGALACTGVEALWAFGDHYKESRDCVGELRQLKVDIDRNDIDAEQLSAARLRWGQVNKKYTEYLVPLQRNRTHEHE